MYNNFEREDPYVVYVQVDSYGDTGVGAVPETHERNGGAYDNIAGPISPTIVAADQVPSAPDTSPWIPGGGELLPERSK